MNASFNTTQTDESKRWDTTTKVHLFFKLIKAIHHLSNISQQQTPKPIERTKQTLIHLIKPAMPSERTQDLIYGNAKNWETTTMLILTHHYNELITELIMELKKVRTDNWKDPLIISAQWARRDLGRRLRPQTVQKAEEIIQTNLTQMDNTHIRLSNIQYTTEPGTQSSPTPRITTTTVTAERHRPASYSPRPASTQNTPERHSYIQGSPEHRRRNRRPGGRSSGDQGPREQPATHTTERQITVTAVVHHPETYSPKTATPARRREDQQPREQRQPRDRRPGATRGTTRVPAARRGARRSPETGRAMQVPGARRGTRRRDRRSDNARSRATGTQTMWILLLYSQWDYLSMRPPGSQRYTGGVEIQ